MSLCDFQTPAMASLLFLYTSTIGYGYIDENVSHRDTNDVSY